MAKNAKTEKKRSWGGRIILILSLAVNLFLIGLIAGGAMWGRHGSMGKGPSMTSTMGLSPMQMRWLVDDEAAKEKLRSIMKESRSDFRVAMGDSMKAHRAIRKALEADPYSADALSQAFEASRQADNNMRRLSQGMVEEFLNSLSDEERTKVLTALNERRWWGRRDGKRGHWRGKDGMGPPWHDRDKEENETSIEMDMDAQQPAPEPSDQPVE